jgi:antirestriction protein
MKIYITNLGKYNEGELIGRWLALPCTEDELEATLRSIGINERYEEWFITDHDNDLGLNVGEYDDINNLNELAQRLEALDSWEMKTLCAVIESETPDAWELMELLDRLDDYQLHPDVHDGESLGHYWIDEVGCYDLDRMGELARYFDYEAFGRDLRVNSNGCYTSYGWLESA